MENYDIPQMTQPPALIIVDAGDLEKKNGLNICYKLKQSEELKNTKIIVTSIIHDKELVLNTGADLYLPKPYEIPTLIKWIDKLIKEYNK
jgi:DNA-binding response OmpR family regulator